MSQICPKCQSENIDDAKFCTSCGSEITQAISSEPIEPVIDDKPIEQPQVESPQKTQPEIKKSISYKKFGLIALVLLLVAGIGGYVWYMTPPSEYKDGDLIEKDGLLVEKRNGNLANSVYRGRYSSGKLFSELEYKNGKREGLYKEYYESGKLKKEIPYINDKREGIVKTYYESGKLEQTMPYKNDKEEGIQHVNFENGGFMSTTYVDGEKEGEQRIRDIHGLIIRQFHHDQKHGWSIFTGERNFRILYENGIPVKGYSYSTNAAIPEEWLSGYN